MHNPPPGRRLDNQAAAVQLVLFEAEAEPAARPGKWIGHRGPWGRNLSWTRSDLPGLVVRHCGHPTALRPFYFTTGDRIPPADGTTYPNLATCQAAAAAWHNQAAVSA